MIVINLSGPCGNAFVLTGRAKQYGRQIGLSKEEIDEIVTDMKSSDYNHLIEVFEDNFDCIIELINKPEKEI